MLQTARTALCTLALLLASIATVINQAGVTYVYDELGRLVAVTDPAGETATYTYDAVGNVLSIARISASTLSIIEFTPNAAPVGTSVTIHGTAFGTVPADNTVRFNGTVATVTSATATRLTATVPAGATTGTISVTTSAGTATSSAPFTVAASTAPAITNFTPTVGNAGTAVTVTGTNFDATVLNNRVKFNATIATVSSSSSTTIATTVPTAAGGRIRIATPAGEAVSADDFFIPPPPYTATDVQFTGRMTFGESKAVPITTSGKIGLVLFDGTAVQRTSLKVEPSLATKVTIYRTDGAVLATRTFSLNGLLEPSLLPATGSYSILVDPDIHYTGTTTVRLYNVPPDATGTITPGGANVTVSFDTPGQNGRLTFTGMTNQRISLKVGSGPYGSVTIQHPDATTLTSGSMNAVPTFIEPKTLTTPGTHAIVLNPNEANTGSVTLTLYDVPPDVSGTITHGGAAVPVTITAGGQNGALTFSGINGQQATVRITSNTVTNLTVKLLKPDGSQLTSSTSSFGTFNLATQTLPVDGTYTVSLDPGQWYTGSFNVQVTNP